MIINWINQELITIFRNNYCPNILHMTSLTYTQRKGSCKVKVYKVIRHFDGETNTFMDTNTVEGKYFSNENEANMMATKLNELQSDLSTQWQVVRDDTNE